MKKSHKIKVSGKLEGQAYYQRLVIAAVSFLTRICRCKFYNSALNQLATFWKSFPANIYLFVQNQQ